MPFFSRREEAATSTPSLNNDVAVSIDGKDNTSVVVQTPKDVSAGKSKTKRGVLAVGVAVGVFVGLYYGNRSTKAEAEATYLADYDGPWYYDEECLSPHERARNLKGDVITSSVTVLINKKRDEEFGGSSGSVMPYITITSVPKQPEAVQEPEAEPAHPEHYRNVRYLDL